MRLPTFDCLGQIQFWYSGKTVVAFQVDGQPRVVRENVWGPTAGKHLNAIDNGDKASRLDGADFEGRLQVVLDALVAQA